MRKLITLTTILAAGTLGASAATVVDEMPSDGLQLQWTFDSSATPTVGSISGENFGYTSGNDYGTISSDDGNHPYKQDLSWSLSDGFAVSLDIRNLDAGSWADILSVKTDNSTNTTFHLQSDASGKLHFYWTDAENTDLEIANLSAFTGTDWATLTFVISSTGITSYINGEVYASATLTSAYTDSIVGFQFGGEFGGSSRRVTSADVDNVAIWNRALTTAEVQAMCGIAPFPNHRSSACSRERWHLGSRERGADGSSVKCEE